MGPNIIDRTCNSIDNTLKIPMFMCEMIYNAYIAPAILNLTGVPTILNYTKQMRQGPGLNASEAFKILDQAKKKESY